MPQWIVVDMHMLLVSLMMFTRGNKSVSEMHTILSFEAFILIFANLKPITGELSAISPLSLLYDAHIGFHSIVHGRFRDSCNLCKRFERST